MMPDLPPGYRLSPLPLDPDMLALVAPSQKTVAVFTDYDDPLDIEALADEDNERVNASIERVERLLGRRV